MKKNLYLTDGTSVWLSFCLDSVNKIFKKPLKTIFNDKQLYSQMPTTVEGSGVLLCVSLPTGKMGVKVVFFVPLNCAPKSACHLLSMHGPFIPPIPLGKIS